MMNTILLKYDHLGSEYLVYDTCKNNLELDAKAIRTICNRNFGLGTQGILAGPVMQGNDMSMKIYQPDGRETAVNRNAAKIFMQYLKDAGYSKQQELVLHTEEGDIFSEEVSDQVSAVGKMYLSEEYAKSLSLLFRQQPDTCCLTA